MRSATTLAVLILAALSGSSAAAGASKARPLDEAVHHIGLAKRLDWKELASPEAPELALRFTATRNAEECVLAMAQEGVFAPWIVSVNGIEVGELRRASERMTFYAQLPPGTLREGDNTLLVAARVRGNDILIGKVALFEQGLRDLLSLRPVRIRVTEQGRPLPARVTVTDLGGKLVPVYGVMPTTTAVRTGVIYPLSGEATVELPCGGYVFTATRGVAYGLARKEVGVTGEPGAPAVVELPLRREVGTPGFLACDTHVHTYTFSGHGDSTIPERLATIAGEGLDLVVATDHNHNTDYALEKAALGLEHAFTAVTGNEVTTDTAHMNAFPLGPADPIPPFRAPDYAKLVAGMRERGARVVILNHPRWPLFRPSGALGPLGLLGFDRRTGARRAGGRFTFDAMEIANSTTLLDDPLYSCQDWFAVLNHGERVTAIGASDSHTVGDPVGQARTYVMSDRPHPGGTVGAVCDAILAGRCSVSLGIFADVTVNGCAMGSLVTAGAEPLDVRLRVAAPSWVHAQRARVFIDGALVADEPLPPADGSPLDRTIAFHPKAPPHDAWLVCAVTGEGVREPCWRTLCSYTLAVTNPVYLDRDGDGRYSSPKDVADAAYEHERGDPGRLFEALRDLDDAAAVELADRALRELEDPARRRFEERIRAAAPPRKAILELLDRGR